MELIAGIFQKRKPGESHFSLNVERKQSPRLRAKSEWPGASLSPSGLHSRQSVPGDRHGMFVFVAENASPREFQAAGSPPWDMHCSREVRAESQPLCHVQLFMTPWTMAHQAPLFVGFFMQENWSGLRFPPPGNLTGPGIEPASSAFVGGFCTTEAPGRPKRGVKDRDLRIDLLLT